MDLKEVMTRDPAFCRADTPVQEVARLMVDNDCGEIPVVDDGRHPIGVVTDRDIAVRIVAEGREVRGTTAADCMTTPATTVDIGSSLSDACDLMETRQIRRVPVVDEQGVLCGIVAQADIALSARGRATADLLKEVSEPAGRH